MVVQNVHHKKKKQQKKKKRRNTFGRFPLPPLCMVFLPAFTGPTPLCPKPKIVLGKPLLCTLSPKKLFCKNPYKTLIQKNKRFFFLVSARLMFDASSVGMSNFIVKYKN